MSSPAAVTQAQVQDTFNRALAAKAARDYRAALAAFRYAFGAAPQAFAAPKLWAALFNAPDWFEGDDEPEAYLDYAEAIMGDLQDYAAAVPQNAQVLARAFVQGAQFRHTTHNLRPLGGFMARRAALFRLALADLAQLMEYDFATPVSVGGKLRYGILLKHLNQDPETIGALSYFEFARAADVEVIVFVVGSAEQPGFGARVRAVADQVIRLPETLTEAIQVLRQADLDILFYANDVTAKPSLPAQLTFFRVARRSFTCVATIATTAAPHMDAYFGGDYFQRQGHDREFTERYIALPFPGFSFSIPVKTAVDPARFDRARFGIPDDALVLASGANHTKLHGRLLRSWAAMLSRLPNAYLLLYPFPPHFGPAQAAMAERWMATIAAAGGDPARVKILPSLGSRDAVIALLRTADIGLDSFPYSGLTTIVDAVEAGLPIVVPSGPVLRNNHAAAILDSIGAHDLIATSSEDYVERTIALASDPQRRAAHRQLLADAMANTPRFLDPQAYCRSVVEACRGLYEEMQIGVAR